MSEKYQIVTRWDNRMKVMELAQKWINSEQPKHLFAEFHYNEPKTLSVVNVFTSENDDRTDYEKNIEGSTYVTLENGDTYCACDFFGESRIADLVTKKKFLRSVND